MTDSQKKNTEKNPGRQNDSVPHEEHELKFVISPAQLAEVRNLPLVESHLGGAPKSKRLITTYYDSADELLKKNGVTLRVRESDGRYKQTIKAAPQCSGSFSRLEWEFEIDSPSPRKVRLQDANSLNQKIKQCLADDSWLDKLEPAFSMDITRGVMPLQGNNWQVEMALDHGTISLPDKALANNAGRKNTSAKKATPQPLFELELELKGGQAAGMYDFAARLSEVVSPLRLSLETKAAQGWAFRQGEDPYQLPQRANPVQLSGDIACAEAIGLIGRNCLSQFIGNQRPILELGITDPEGVHQMRVAVRRLKSVLSVFAPFFNAREVSALKSDLSWINGFLGPARDLDVFIAEILGPVEADLKNREDGFEYTAGMAELRNLFEDRRRQAYEALCKALHTPRFTRLLIALAGWIETGLWKENPGQKNQKNPKQAADGDATLKVGPHAAALLEKRARKVIRTGDDLGELTDVARHDLRIRLKKLRYAADFFRDIDARTASGKKKAKAYMSSLKSLQDDLGTLNDIAVAREMLRQISADSLASPQNQVSPQNQASPHNKIIPETVSPAAAWAAGMVAGWHGGRVNQLLADVNAHWAAFRKSAPFWARYLTH